jgi:signal transduction histidine kinase
MRDAMTNMIIHDLKSPVNVISGTIMVVLEGISEGGKFFPEAARLLNNAMGSCKQMTELINDVLDSSRMEEKQLPLTKTEVNFGSLVKAYLESIEALRKKYNVSFKLDFAKDLPPVSLDESMLQRVLANIITNSMKFTPAGGAITIATRYMASDKQIECSIEDTGIGIPKEHLEKIFDKFFQGSGLDKTRKGQGLGLAFCRLAVESHGGRIWAESEEGKGSKFVFRLPLS